MNIKELFKKDITRDIDGVVMIGNESEAKKVQELDEYVCTNEIVTNFRSFFSAYRKSTQAPTDKMGVWITGFFGSGKSHFLKILGYILSNEEVGGKKALEYFDDKIKDPMIKADMRTSASQNNLVILFNIDSKAKSDAKNRNISIMETMLSCFNEKIGLCGSVAWLAELERGLVKDGLFEKFITHFNELSGKDYLKQRKNIFFLRDKFIQTLSDIKGISQESARAYFDDAQKNYSINIESFAKIIADYCQDNNCRVVFLMDEVGQFIGTNSDMMLGLQTVVEDLGKYANSKAWVVVTSQQQIDALVEGTNKAAQLDFSKIQGRFATRLTMSSSNADEVIKKRLLDKTEDAKNYLGAVYDKNADKLNNLLIFPANPKWTGYKDKEQFIDDYPFVNYQYELLQKVFDSIRENGMSEGKSISSGERSLLSAFKESAQAKCLENVGLLIPFNDFYKTAEEFMDWNIKQVFSNAHKRMSDPFDIDVLETLFMLKGVKEMEPTIERIATLMVKSMDDDKVVLKTKIKASLDRLIAETFVQQNGDRYEFLTNEEQDVNRKIKNSPYSTSEVYNKIREIIYDGVLEVGNKFAYGKYSFGLNRYIDDNITGSANPDNITVKIYTPWDNKDMSNEQRSYQDSGCLVIDISNGSYLEELIQHNKIQTFDRNNASMPSSTLQDILQKKRAEASEREKRAKTNIEDCLKNAKLYQWGSKLEINTTDAKKRFAEGIARAILNKYNKLDYVKNFANKTEDITNVLKNNQIELGDFIQDDANTNALKDIMSFLKEEKNFHRPVTMTRLLERFKKAPYGYRDLDIRFMVAGLLNHNYLRVLQHGEVQKITNTNFGWDFARSNNGQYILIELQEKIDDALLMKVRTIMKNAFGRTIELKETSLRDESLEFFRGKLEDLNKIYYSHQTGSYPGKQLVNDMITIYKMITATDDAQSVFEKIVKNEDKLMDFGDIMDSIISFYKEGGSQMTIWNNANSLVKYYFDNMMFVEGIDAMADVVNKMQGILSEEMPFSDIPDLGSLVSEANKIKTSLIEGRKNNAKKDIDKYFDNIDLEYQQAVKKDFKQSETKNKIDERYHVSIQLKAALIKSIEQEDKIDAASSRAKQELESFRHDLASIIAKDTPNTSVEPTRRVARVRSNELIPVASKKITKSEELDDLIKNIREKLEKLLNDNDEIDID